MKNTFLKRNSSTILTTIGAIGVVATAVIAVKDTPKALRILDEAEQEKGEELTVKEKIVTAGPVYIPAIAVGISTIACIFGANTLNKRNQAALMSAYALLDKSYKDYKRKVSDIYGEDADKKIIEEVAKEELEPRDNTDDTDDSNVVTIFDGTTMRSFESVLDRITTDDGMEIYCIETPQDLPWWDS
jgi:hypothetical protein